MEAGNAIDDSDPEGWPIVARGAWLKCSFGG
jgi:hypothetical protein